MIKKRASAKMLLDSALSLIGKGSSQVTNTAILLLIAWLREPAELGSYSLATKYAALLLGLTLLGFDSLLVRDVAQNPRQARNYVTNLSLLRLSISILAYAGVALLIIFVPGYTPHTTRVIILFTLTLVPEGLYRLYQSVFATLNDYSPLAWIGASKAVLGLLLGAGTLWLGASLETIVLLQVCVSWATLILTLIPLRTSLKSVTSVHGSDDIEKLSARRARKWLKEAFSLAIIDGLFVIDGQIDVILLSLFVNEQQVGFYSLAQTILSILMLLLYSADMVIFPFLSQTVVKKQSIGQVHHRLFVVIATVTIPFACLLTLILALLIPRLFGGKFIPALAPLYWLTVTWVIHFLNVPNARLMIALGKQNALAAFLASSLVLNVLLSISLIPLFGIKAPAIGRTTSTTLYAALCTIVIIRLLLQKRPHFEENTGNTTKELLLSEPN